MTNIPLPTFNSQTQIFIINQFNNYNLTDLEITLLNILVNKAYEKIFQNHYSRINNEYHIHPGKLYINNTNITDKLLTKYVNKTMHNLYNYSNNITEPNGIV